MTIKYAGLKLAYAKSGKIGFFCATHHNCLLAYFIVRKMFILFLIAHFFYQSRNSEIILNEVLAAVDMA